MSLSPCAGVKALLEEGWPLEASNLEKALGPDKPLNDATKLRQILLDMDLRDCSVPMLVDRVNRQSAAFKGPLVVQLLKTRNCSYPKMTEMTHPDGVLKLQFGDGHSSVFALLLEAIPKLGGETPPGVKVLLSGEIPLENDMLMVNSRNCRVLGGTVQKLVEKWQLEKSFSNKQTRSADHSAPKWTSFSEKVSSWASNGKGYMGGNGKVGVNANAVIAGATGGGKPKKGGDGEFDANRKANIEMATDAGSTKKFAPSQIRPKAVSEGGECTQTAMEPKPSNGFKKAPPQRAEHENPKNRRRSNHGDDAGEDGVARPSQPPTLLDFVQSHVGGTVPDTKPPLTAPPITNVPNVPVNVDFRSQPRPIGRGGHRGMGPTDRDSRYRPAHGGRQDRYWDDDNRNGGGRGGRMHYSNGRGGSRNSHQGGGRYPQGAGGGGGGGGIRSGICISQKAPPVHEMSALALSADEEFPTIEAATSGEQASQEGRIGNRSGMMGEMDPARFRANYRLPEGRGAMWVGRNQGNRGRRQTDHRGGRPFTDYHVELVTWNVGDSCLAPWSDFQFYPSTIVAMGPADMCTVEYDGYDQRSVVPLGVLLVTQGTNTAR